MKRLGAGAAVLIAIGGSMAATAGPGTAATAHCADHQSAEKVELDYETTTIEVAPGSTVCYKSGTQVFTVVADEDGVVTSTATNKAGKVQAISYYIVIDTPPHS